MNLSNLIFLFRECHFLVKNLSKFGFIVTQMLLTLIFPKTVASSVSNKSLTLTRDFIGIPVWAQV
jgi:hypothetical protein